MSGGPILPSGDGSDIAAEENELITLFEQADAAYLAAPFGDAKHMAKTALIMGLDDFVTKHTNSVFNPAVRIELGLSQRHRLQYSHALENQLAAWNVAKLHPEEPGKSLALRAADSLAEILVITGRLDDFDRLESECLAILGQTSHGTGWQWAKETAGWLRRHPTEGYKCGIYCVDQLGRLTAPGRYDINELLTTAGGPNGFSASELIAIGGRAGLGIRAGWLEDWSEIPVPSIVHLRSEHFVVVRRREGSFYQVYDTVAGGALWLHAEDVAVEASGCVLVSTGSGGAGFARLKPLDQAAAAAFRGRLVGAGSHMDSGPCDDSSCDGAGCPPGDSNDGESDTGPGPGGGGGGGCSSCGAPGADVVTHTEPQSYGSVPKPAASSQQKPAEYITVSVPHAPQTSAKKGEQAVTYGPMGGMPRWYTSEPFVNLWVQDVPLDYRPAYGPSATLRLTFMDQRYGSSTVSDGWRGAYFSKNYGDFPRWTSSWLCYAVPDDSGLLLEVMMPSGGWAQFAFANSSTTNSDVNYRLNLQAQKIGSAGTPTGYKVLRPDGSIVQFSALVSGTYYMSAIAEPSGAQLTFNYTGARLNTVQAADGVTFTLVYGGSDTNLITSITSSSSYGASLTFSHGETGGPGSLTYDAGILTGITDAVGIKSQVFYETVDGLWVNTLITPYGTTSFETWPGSSFSSGGDFDRGVRITHPDGTKELYAGMDTYNGNDWPSFSGGQIPSTADAAVNTLDTADRSLRNTFHWTRGQYSPIASTALSAFTWSELKRGRIRHWLLKTDALFVYTHFGTISWEQSPSSDGSTEGPVLFYDYAGKPGGANNENGTQVQPAVKAVVMPDGTSAWSYWARNSIGKPTTQIDKWVESGSAKYRTNSWSYESNLMDLTYHIGADGVTNVWLKYDQANHPHLPVAATNAIGESTIFVYRGGGTHQISIITNAYGVVSTYAYNSNDQLTNIVDSVSGTPIRTNSIIWQSTSKTNYTAIDSRGLSVEFTFDYLNRPVRAYYPDGTDEQEIYSLGTALSGGTGGTKILDRTGHKDRLGYWTYFNYNGLRQIVTTTNALGTVTGFGYCDCGGLSYVTNDFGASKLNEVTHYVRDLVGRVTEVYPPTGGGITNTYDGLGRKTVVGDAIGTNTVVYDNLDRVVQIQNPKGTVSKAIYNAVGQATNTTDSAGVVTTLTFDQLGRLRTITPAGGGTTSYGYTANVGPATSFTNATSNVTLFSFDGFSRKTSEVQVGLWTNSFTYSPAGDLLSLGDGRSQTTTWTYTTEGLEKSKYDARGTNILSYSYDATGLITNAWSLEKGNTAYVRDAVGNPTKVDYPTGTDINNTYDALGRLTKMVDASGTNSFSYLAGGLIYTEDGPWASDTVTYSYGNARELLTVSLQQPTGSFIVTNTWDTGRRLSMVTSPSGQFTYWYTNGPAARAHGISWSAGAKITNRFDSLARLTNTVLLTNGTSVANSHGYDYDNANRRTKQYRTDGSYVDYTYDAGSQLLKALGSGGSSTENLGYGYDAAMNLTIRTNSGTPGYYYVSSNVLNQVLGDSTYTYTYDGNGNRSHRGQTGGYTVDFTYDCENELTQAITDTSNSNPNKFRSSFTYDGKGRLRKVVDSTWNDTDQKWETSSDTRYVYVGMLVIQERNSSNTPIVSYTRGTDLSGSLSGAGGIGGLLARAHTYSSGSWSSHNMYHADGNGNVTFLVSSASAPSAEYRYDPYGRTTYSNGTLATANVLRFSSKLWHEKSGFYYYGYRFYEPSTQRWINRDPIQESGGINLYAFVGNRAGNTIDILGLQGLQYRPSPTMRPTPTVRPRGQQGRGYPRIDRGRERGGPREPGIDEPPVWPFPKPPSVCMIISLADAEEIEDGHRTELTIEFLRDVGTPPRITPAGGVGRGHNGPPSAVIGGPKVKVRPLPPLIIGPNDPPQIVQPGRPVYVFP